MLSCGHCVSECVLALAACVHNERERERDEDQERLREGRFHGGVCFPVTIDPCIGGGDTTLMKELSEPRGSGSRAGAIGFGANGLSVNGFGPGAAFEYFCLSNVPVFGLQKGLSTSSGCAPSKGSLRTIFGLNSFVADEPTSTHAAGVSVNGFASLPISEGTATFSESECTLCGNDADFAGRMDCSSTHEQVLNYDCPIGETLVPKHLRT